MDKERIYSQKTISGVATTRYYMSNHEVIVNSLGHETYIIYLCNGSIAVHDKAASTKTLYHGYYDAQGSLIALTDNSGNVVARFAYDPWGSRVSPTDWSQSVDSPSVLGIERGYTMHEHLDEFDLINMNGRVYDPAVSQFLSPDPYIQDDGNWLNYNRYAYCYNNPMKYVDPDGEFAISAFLLGMVVSAAIDYGMQVAFNHKFGYRGKDAWVNNVDFFDIAVSGAIGGLTAGCGASLKAGESIGRLGSWFVNNPKAVKLGELVLTSAVDITGNGFQNVESEMFGSRMLIGGMTWTTSNIISTTIANKQFSNLEFRENYNYDLDPYGDNVVLYRGITGSEGKGGPLFLTDNIEYAATYVEKGGSIASVTVPRSTLNLMEARGDLGLLRGTVSNGFEYGIEYKIYSTTVINDFILRFNYTIYR